MWIPSVKRHRNDTSIQTFLWKICYFFCVSLLLSNIVAPFVIQFNVYIYCLLKSVTLNLVIVCNFYIYQTKDSGTWFRVATFITTYLWRPVVALFVLTLGVFLCSCQGVFTCTKFYESCIYLWNKLINQCLISRASALSVHCHHQELLPTTTQTDSRKTINSRRAVVSSAVSQIVFFFHF